MPKRVPLKMTGPLALRVNWIERLVPEQHLSGTTAEERARLTHTLGMMLFAFSVSGLSFLWGLYDPRSTLVTNVINFVATSCYFIDLALFSRYGGARWLVLLMMSQAGCILLALLAAGGQLAFLIWLVGPPMLLMFLASLRAAYVGTALAVLAALVLGYLKERGLLVAKEPAGFLALMSADGLAISTWILCQLPLVLVFDIRRSWAAGEARLITRIMLNAKQQTRALMDLFREQLEAVLEEPELSAEVLEGLQEAEVSAQRLDEVIDQLARIAAQEPAAAGQLQHRLEQIGQEAPSSLLTAERPVRFLLWVSLSFFVICCVLVPTLLLLKGPYHPLSWLVMAALVLLIPNIVFLRRRFAPWLPVAWITLQVVVLCVGGALLTGDLAQAVWLSHVPVVLLYIAGARWALGSAVVLVVLLAVLSAAMQAGYGLPPQAPLSGSAALDQAGFSGLFIVMSMLLVGYFERDRVRSASVLTLRSSALSKLSHELRTPLNGILGMISWMCEELPSEGASLAHLSLAERYAQKLLSLIDDALSLAVLSGGRVERKVAAFAFRDLEAQVRQEAERLGELHFAAIEVSCGASGPEHLSGEYVRLLTMLVSLLEWACGHRPAQSIALRLSVERESRSLWCLDVALLDRERPDSDGRVTGLAEQFVQDHRGRDRNAVRVTLCRAQVDYLGGRLQALEENSGGLLISLPLKQPRR